MAEEAKKDKDSKESSGFVTWTNQFPFEQRELSVRDWKAAGADLDLNDDEVKSRPNTVWSSANGWRVPREEVPLSDVQLGVLMGQDSRFKIVEG